MRTTAGDAAAADPSASSPPPARTAWGRVALLVLAGIAAAMMFSKVAAIFVPVSDLFETDDVATGLAMSLPALVAVALGVSAGVLVGELGARRVLLVSLGAGAAVSLVQAIPMPGWAFLCLRVVEGAAHLGIVVAAPVIIIAVTAARQRGAVMAVWGTFFGLGFAIAGWLAPPLAELGGPRLVFVAHGALMLLIAIAISVVVAPRVVAGRRDERLSPGRFLREHLETYRDPRSVLPGAVFVWHTFMYTAILTFVPLFGDPADEAFLLVAMPLVSIAGTLIAGALVRFAPAAGLLVAGYLLVGATILAIWWLIAAGALTVLVVATVLMLFSGLIQGAAFALIPAMSVDPAVGARANGALTQVANIGSVLGPPVLAGVIAASAPSFGPFALVVAGACAAGVVASTVAWRWTRVTRRDAGTSPSPA